MASTYVNDLRLEEMATGDQSGTWGDTTNTNLELIAEAFSYGTEASFGSDADATTTIADGASDPARSLYLKITSSVSLTATRTLTIAPNTVSKIWIIENATSGSQSINISQGSGANVTIPSGDVKVIYTDGAGAGAAVVDAFTDLNLSGTTTVAALDAGSGAITTTGTVTGGTLAGTLSTAAQPNITSLGTLTALTGGTGDLNWDSGTLFVDSSANAVGIGTTSPSGKVHVQSASSGATASGNADELILEGSGNTGLSILSGATSLGNIFFADSGDTADGYINYDQSGRSMRFGTATTERMRIDVSGNVGIGTSSPSNKLHVVGDVFAESGSFYVGGGGVVASDSTSRDLNFAIGNTTPKMTLDTSGNVGIGTTTPITNLHIQSTSEPAITLFHTAVQVAQIGLDSSGSLTFGIDGSTGATERMKINTSGKVGIGTASPSALLDVAYGDYENSGALRIGANIGTNTSRTNATRKIGALTVPHYTTSENDLVVFLQDSDSGGSPLSIGGNSGFFNSPSLINFFTSTDGTTNGSERMRIDSSGNVSIGTTNANNRNLYIQGAGGYIGLNSTTGGFTTIEGLDNGTKRWRIGQAGFGGADGFAIYTGASDTERMRIDSSGNLLVGKTSTSISTQGLAVNSTGMIKPTTTNEQAALFNRLSSDGDIVEFRKDGSTVGSIGATAGVITIGNSNSGGIIFGYSGSHTFIEPSNTSGASVDDGATLGSSSKRFRDLYLSGAITAGAASTSPVVMTLATANSNCDITMNSANTSSVTRLRNGTNDFQIHTNGAERMRIDSSGNLLVGKTSSSFASAGVELKPTEGLIATVNGSECAMLNRLTSTGTIQRFKQAGTDVGSISVTASATAYNTSSDARLKDVTGSARGLEVINELNPVAYNWKADGKADEGLIAQEVLDIVPNAVSGSEEEMYQMDYSKLVVHLVKGMKEQQAQIEALQSEINLLKGE